MKKKFLIALLLVPSLFIKAQELHNEITDVLDRAPKVYNESQILYQKVTGYRFVTDCVLEIYTHAFPVRQGEDDYDLKRGYKKIIIDFSQVKLVSKNLKTTNYGYKGIFVSTYFAGEGGKYIKVQRTEPDQHGNHGDNYGDVEWLSTIVIPIDTEELIPFLQELQRICTQ